MPASENVIYNAVSAAQVRAARGLISWSQDQLASASGVPKRTIARLELAEGSPQRRTLAAIRTALEAAGVAFIPENGGGAGVRLRKPSSPADTTAPLSFAETIATALATLPAKAAEDPKKQ